MEQTPTPRPPATLSEAVFDMAARLSADPTSVESKALDILKAAPGQPHAVMLLVSARRLAGDLSGASEVLREILDAQPKLAAVQYELGVLLSELGDNPAAIEAFFRVVELEPNHPSAWRVLGDQLSKAGDIGAAGQAYLKHANIDAATLEIMESAARGPDDQLSNAEKMLLEWLNIHPSDVPVLQMLGSVYIRLGRFEDAEKYLSRALELVPDFSSARWMLAGTFLHRANWEKTLSEVEKLLNENPEKSEYLDLKAYSLLNTGEFEAAIACYETLVPKYPTAENWKSYGYALRVIGRQEDSIAAYRQAIALRPTFGQAYLGLANIKTFRFHPADIETMSETLKSAELDSNSRSQMHFALGKAFEDMKQYAPSFEEYRKGNAILRMGARHSADEVSKFVRRSKVVFTSKFFHERSGWGALASGPIFIVGLPRSGSTLIEQILASHSLVEAAGELTTLDSLAIQLSARNRARGRIYPELLQELRAKDIGSAGQEYLDRTRLHRKLDRPFFIDKMPNNFVHLGLLLLCLPNAKIIDARRHPLGSGFAIYKHYFLRGHSFAFDLTEIGRYYRDYVELLAHFDIVLPGRIHRVIYEQMVTNSEQEIRRLLDYCGLPFEEACLRFHETKRGVLTPSSEQVRQPIFTEAMEQWRNFENWLGPMKAALGEVLTLYPEVPRFGENLSGYGAQWGLSGGYRQISAVPPARMDKA